MGFTKAVKIIAPHMLRFVCIESSNTFGRLSSTDLDAQKDKFSSILFQIKKCMNRYLTQCLVKIDSKFYPVDLH